MGDIGLNTSNRTTNVPLKAIDKFSCLPNQISDDSTYISLKLNEQESLNKHRYASPAARSGNDIIMHRSSSSDAILLHYLSGEWPKHEAHTKQFKLPNKSWRPTMTSRYEKSFNHGTLISPRKKTLMPPLLLINNKVSTSSNERLNQELERLSLDNFDSQMSLVPDGHRCPIDELLSIGTPPLPLPPSLISCYLRPPSEDSGSEGRYDENCDISDYKSHALLTIEPMLLNERVKQVLPKKNMATRLEPDGAECSKKILEINKESLMVNQSAYHSFTQKTELNIPSGQSAFEIYPSIIKNTITSQPSILCLAASHHSHLHNF